MVKIFKALTKSEKKRIQHIMKQNGWKLKTSVIVGNRYYLSFYKDKQIK